MKTTRFLIFAVLVCFAAAPLAAQIQTEQYNPHSVRPIRKEDQMFKKALWWRMDLRTKMNTPFFSQNSEITRLLIDAVKEGRIIPYSSDSLEHRLTLDEFHKRLRMPQFDLEMATPTEIESLDDWDNWEYQGGTGVSGAAAEYLPRQLYLLELKEDLIFDNRRSRMYNDINAVTIIIPGSENPAGLDKVLCAFSYKELVDKVFKDNPKAVWFNPQNSAFHHNFSDAFSLRMFEKTLVKYENPRGNAIIDLFQNPRKALIMSEQTIFQLMEYEATLWSY